MDKAKTHRLYEKLYTLVEEFSKEEGVSKGEVKEAMMTYAVVRPDIPLTEKQREYGMKVLFSLDKNGVNRGMKEKNGEDEM